MRDHLKNVQQIQATDAAFAAVPGDGSVRDQLSYE